MKYVVITSPEFISDEPNLIRQMLDAGVDYVHIRKPNASADDVMALVRQIGFKYHNRLVIHYHHVLAEYLSLGGFHLSERCPVAPAFWSGRISCSCHSLNEVIAIKPKVDYCFLSPIFNSISKQGYNSNFTDEVLQQAASDGIVDDKVFALGGVTPESVPYLRSVGFGGFAVLGSIWQADDPVGAVGLFTKYL